MAYVRTDRVAEDIKKELSEMMRLRLRDPRLSEMASIVSVELARDFSHATVRVSVMGDEAAQKDSIKALESAAGFMRRELGKRLHIHHTPQLHFELDTSIEYVVKIAKILRDLDVKPETEEENADEE